jgi:predicted enzyme related to lactoylglutathione lyase
MFMLKDKMVAGLGPLFSPEQHPAWSTYVSTADAVATADAVRAAGGQVIMDPMDVLDAGSMAVFTDPTGAFFGVWQPKQHRGAQLVNEPGALIWNELDTRDLPAAKTFYKAVFGWDGESSAGDGGMPYTEWKLDGKSIAGAMEITEAWPATAPPIWLTYFAVADCDATVAQAEQRGGSVNVPPTDTSVGRFAVLSDPHGAMFAVIAVPQ